MNLPAGRLVATEENLLCRAEKEIMQERDFIQLLQKRASEQKKELDAVPFPKFFSFAIVWLSDHPWRFLIPLAFFISLILRGIIGHGYTDFVLWIFRSI